MLIYNRITELVYDQFLILFLVEIIILLLTIFLFKKKLSFKLILFSSILAIVLSLLSMIIVNGFYGGMAYHERFGWPFPFQMTSRSIEDISTPWGIHFDFLKFFANTIYWGIFPLSILFEILSEKKGKRYQFFTIGSLTFLVVLTILFSHINNPNIQEMSVEEVSETTIVDDNQELTDLETRKRDAIEVEYPEFKNFIENSSFAGTSIKAVEQDSDHYYAYIVHGSGVPIALATCFRVDRMFRVYKIGEFPDPLDSYFGYMDIDPVNCTGIK